MQDINISILDSQDDAKMVYIVANECKVKILKVKLNNLCYIMKVLGDVCHIEFDTKGCEKASK